MSLENELAHYGVKGMRWGQRKAKSAKRKVGLPDRSMTRFEKSAPKLSDAELRRRINRLEMEKRYNDLNRRQITEGESMVKGLLKNTGTAVAGSFLTAAAMYAGKTYLEKKFGSGLVEGMFPKKKK